MKRCSFEGCFQQAVFYNRQSILLGKDEERQQFVFRVYHSCIQHLWYYARSDGRTLYQQEKWHGQQRMFFLVTPQHLALAKRLYIVWDNAACGAPGASVMQPYGKSSYLAEVAEAIGFRRVTSDDDFFSPEEEKYLEGLHQEMRLILQIILHTGQTKPGIYMKSQSANDWRVLEHPEDEPELIFALSEDDVPEPHVDLRGCLTQYVRYLWEQDFSQTEIRMHIERETRENLKEMGLIAESTGRSTSLPWQIATLINDVIEEECQEKVE